MVGGGVIGVSCAYYLAKSGWRVTIIEKGTFGQGTSSGNCGFVCPSHILPLAEPGAVFKTLGTMFKRNSPLKIRFRLDPSLWSWLARFAKRCNQKDMLDAGRAIQPLLDSSMTLYEHLIASESLDCEWQKKGLLFAFKNPVEMEAYAKVDSLLSQEFHCEARRIGAKALVETEPALKTNLAGGWLYEDDGHLRPDKLLKSWRKTLDAMGVVVKDNCKLDRFDSENGAARSVVTQSGEIEADAFIAATGALTPLLNDQFGCRIPIQPGKGYSITMARPAICPLIPMIFPETRVAVTPFQSGYRLGSTMEFAGYDPTLNRARLQLLRDGAEDYLLEPYCEPVEEEWYGWRPMTYDSIPIIDKSPRYSNVYIAAGHNMLGLSMAPATGKLLSEMINGGPCHLNPKPYSLDRFG